MVWVFLKTVMKSWVYNENQSKVDEKWLEDIIKSKKIIESEDF